MKRRADRGHREVLWQYLRVLNDPIKFRDNGRILTPHVHDNVEVSTLGSDDSAIGMTAVIRSGISAF